MFSPKKFLPDETAIPGDLLFNYPFFPPDV